MTDCDPYFRKLAVFGGYSTHDLYQRNRTLVRVFSKFAEEVEEVRPDKQHAAKHAFSSQASPLERFRAAVSNAWSLWRQRHRVADADAIFVPYPAYLDLLLLMLFRRRKDQLIIADAFLELHSTLVEDRGFYPAESIPAKAVLLLQRICLKRADILLIDTALQLERLKAALGSAGPPVYSVPVGIDGNQWAPLPPRSEPKPYQVLFWGTFIPLHGVSYILDAAKRLLDKEVPVHIHLIGDGQTADSLAAELVATPLSNLSWRRELVATEELREAVAESDIVLGVFGLSDKAGEVIPYKVHQALASDKPVISRHGDAIAPFVDEGAGLVTCNAGDGEALATAVEACVRRLQSGWTPRTRSIFDANFAMESLTQQVNELLSAELSQR